jgi:hypothetical protein
MGDNQGVGMDPLVLIKILVVFCGVTEQEMDSGKLSKAKEECMVRTGECIVREMEKPPYDYKKCTGGKPTVNIGPFQY